MKFLDRSCLEAARLLSKRADHRLTLVERLALRRHLAVCGACPRFARQVDLLRSAVGRWKQYTED
ncbi:zf-HC2 domain-containing protein [Piscinibacter sp. Jin2]|uniref:Zf-HC2 domain-containing protein n=1 Tax=Aquariibacter lacus TaxID=2801332 RepID=A0A9X1BR69_9BURK|nr:zf-HC2 domain-containing protein [Piscinibacter lacus]MBL0720421.1 zf-HC2 domain-containing protein [Piscinibacter lacus]